METEVINDQKSEFTKNLRRDSNINALLLAGFWIIYFIIELFMPGIIQRFIPDTESPLFRNAATLTFYILLYPIGFPLLFLLFRTVNRGNKDMKILGCLRKPQMPAWWVVRWIILTIGFTYLASFLSQAIFWIIETLTGYELNPADMSTDNTALGIITTIISAPVFAPVFEELFFRGTLYRNVRSYGTWSMLIVGGLTFGLWHANYPQFLFAAVMGFFSCFLYAKTKSVIPSMIVHFIINSMGAFDMILLGQLGISGPDDIAEITEAEMSALLMDHIFVMFGLLLLMLLIVTFLITWLIMLIIELCLYRDSFRFEKKDLPVSDKKAFVTYMTAPGMLVLMLFMLGLTVFRALGGQL